MYALTPQARYIEPYVWVDNVFSDQELDALKGRAAASTQKAIVGSNSTFDPSIRKSNVNWISNTPQEQWIFEKIAHSASYLNAQFYGFDLSGLGEELQLTGYDASEHGMYGWHQDFNANISRKLSIVVQLSDPSEYDGGNLQIANGAEPITVKKQRGLVCAFPSFNLHQVTPVTRGSRYSLVAWVSGPAFK